MFFAKLGGFGHRCHHASVREWGCQGRSRASRRVRSRLSSVGLLCGSRGPAPHEPLSPVGFKIPSSSVVLKHKGLEASEKLLGMGRKFLEAGSGRQGWQDSVELNIADLDSRLRGWLLYLKGEASGFGKEMDQSRVAWSGQDVPGGMGMPWEGCSHFSLHSAHFYQVTSLGRVGLRGGGEGETGEVQWGRQENKVPASSRQSS